MELQRYELAGTYDDDVRPRDDGRWCESDDVAKLEALNAELLDALEALLNLHDDGDYDGPDPAEQARAAIAKAKGGGSMSEFKHTPGPWRFVRGYDNSNAVITGEGHGLECVALVKSTSCPEADARLIAAAPELLEALEKALDALGGNDPHDLGYDDSICGYIRAAIAKAKGDQP